MLWGSSLYGCQEKKGPLKPYFEELLNYERWTLGMMKINHWSKNAAMTDITGDYNFII